MEAKTLQNNKSRTAFLMAVARGRKWQRDIDEGKVRDIKELTEILSLDQSYVSRILRLSHLAPPLIERVINGTPALSNSTHRAHFNIKLVF